MKAAISRVVSAYVSSVNGQTTGTFLALSAPFSSIGCCISSWITLKIVALEFIWLHICVATFIHESENWQCLPAISRTTFHHALVTFCCNLRRVRVQLLNRITTRIHLNLVKAMLSLESANNIPCLVSESLGINSTPKQ